MDGPDGPFKRARNYIFNHEWEDKYCFIDFNDKCTCILCGNSIMVAKHQYVEHHFQSVHPDFDSKYPPRTEERAIKISKLKTLMLERQSAHSRHAENFKKAAVASLKISHMLAKKMKPFQDGELIKEMFLTGAECLFEGFGNKPEIMAAIEELQLTNNPTIRKISLISVDVQNQLRTDLGICDSYSLLFDETRNMSDQVQLAILVRLVFNNYTAKEDLLELLPIQEDTTGEEIYNKFKTFAISINLPLQKMSAMITDGSPKMIGMVDGFVALCKKDASFQRFVSYHCTIHPEGDYYGIIPFEHVDKIVANVIKSIRAGPFQHRMFKVLLEEPDARWLGKTKLLASFLSLIEEIKTYLSDIKEPVKHLTTTTWLVDLGFYADLMGKLFSLNLQLQSKENTLADMISAINAFKAKLALFISYLQNRSLVHFPNMREMLGEHETEMCLYINYLQVLQKHFAIRFRQFENLEPIVSFSINPYNAHTDVTELAGSIADFIQCRTEDVEMEILALKNNIALKSLVTEDFWNVVKREKYPLLKKATYKIKSLFGSAYLSETLYTNSNLLKLRYRSRLNDDYLYDCLHIGLSSYTPNYDELAADVECPRSY